MALAEQMQTSLGHMIGISNANLPSKGRSNVAAQTGLFPSFLFCGWRFYVQVHGDFDVSL